MSGTSKAMGRQIEEFMKWVNASKRGYNLTYLSVGEVAEANECTKATARKYLQMLEAAKIVKSGDARGRGGWRKVYAFNEDNREAVQ